MTTTPKFKTSGNPQFDALLRTFRKYQTGVATSAMACAVFALEHYAGKGNGDVSLLVRFYDEMTDNLLRKTAFLAWVEDFSDIKVTSKRPLKMVKDKSPTANKLDIEGAKEVNWWDHKPDPELQEWTVDSLIGLLHGVVKKLSNTDRCVPKEGTDANVLTITDRHIDQLEKMIRGNSNVTETSQAA